MLQVTLIILAASVALAAMWFWITMMVHCVRNTQPGSRERRDWLLIVTLGKLPGAFAYYLRKRAASPGP